MGKRSKSTKAKPDASADETSNSSEPFHNPFEGLAELRDRLPEDDRRHGDHVRDADPAPGGAHPEREPPGLGSDKLVVRRERKGRAGKTVTVIEGLDDSIRDAMAGRLRRELGCGGWVEGRRVVLQGAQVERAAEWLRARGARRVSVSP